MGTTQALGIVLGITLVSPQLLNAYSVATTAAAEIPKWNFGLFQVDMIGYQAQVLPAVLAGFTLVYLERFFRKTMSCHDFHDCGPLLLPADIRGSGPGILGPIGWKIGAVISDCVNAGLTSPFKGVFAGILGFFYAPLVITGLHHMSNAIDLQLIADFGGTTLWPMIALSNIAQGSAVLAMILLQKNDAKAKEVSVPACISCYLGVTEPAMFGVTLKLKYPFYAAMAGSAAGSAYLAATKTLAQALGAAGLPGFISMKPDHYMNFAIGIILSMGVSFALTMVFWKKFALGREDGPEKKDAGRAEGTETASDMEISRKIEMPQEIERTREIITELYVPMKGQVLDVGQSADEVFASKALGDGVAINPAEGMVCAPCDGTISLLFPTKHAVGITSETGVEVLIHIGINTVQLDGQGFEAFVAQGDKVKKGHKLIAADLDLIREKGLNPQTMMILPEGGNLDVTVYPGGQADSGDLAVKAVKTVKTA